MTANVDKPTKYLATDNNYDVLGEYVDKLEALKYVFSRAAKGLHFTKSTTCDEVFKMCNAFFADKLTSLCQYVPHEKFEEALTKLRDIIESKKKRKLEEIKTTRSQKLKSLYARLKNSAADMSLSPEENAMVSRLGSPEQLVYNKKTANDIQCQCQRTIEILLELSIACPRVFHEDDETDSETMLVRVFEYGQNNYVMQEELHLVLHGIEPDITTLYDRVRNLYTYTTEDALKMVEEFEEEDEIKFLWMNEIDGRSQTIRTVFGEGCNYAKVVLDQIISATFDKARYYSVDRFLSSSDEFGAYLEKLRDFFGCQKETPVYFIPDEAMESMKKTLLSLSRSSKQTEIPKRFKKIEEEVSAKMEEFLEKNPEVCLLKAFPILEGFLHSQQHCHFYSSLECCRVKSPKTARLERQYDAIEKEMEQIAEQMKQFWADNPTKVPKSSELEKVVPKREESEPKKADKESTTKCDKCYRTSEYCEEAKKELKTSKNAVNKLKQKVSENEKAVKELAECKKKMAEMEQEMKKLRKTVEDSEKILKTKEKENENLQKTTKLLEEELAKVKEELSSYKPMSQEARNNVISSIEDKLKVLDAEQPLQRADEKLRSLNRWLTAPNLKNKVKKDFETFHEQKDGFCATLHSIRDMLNENLTRRELSDVPTCPEQLERFRRIHQEMLVTCRCGNVTHLACQRTYGSVKCGLCRANFLF